MVFASVKSKETNKHVVVFPQTTGTMAALRSTDCCWGSWQTGPRSQLLPSSNRGITHRQSTPHTQESKSEVPVAQGGAPQKESVGAKWAGAREEIRGPEAEESGPGSDPPACQSTAAGLHSYCGPFFSSTTKSVWLCFIPVSCFCVH